MSNVVGRILADAQKAAQEWDFVGDATKTNVDDVKSNLAPVLAPQEQLLRQMWVHEAMIWSDMY